MAGAAGVGALGGAAPGEERSVRGRGFDPCPVPDWRDLGALGLLQPRPRALLVPERIKLAGKTQPALWQWREGSLPGTGAVSRAELTEQTRITRSCPRGTLRGD